VHEVNKLFKYSDADKIYVYYLLSRNMSAMHRTTNTRFVIGDYIACGIERIIKEKH